MAAMRLRARRSALLGSLPSRSGTSIGARAQGNRPAMPASHAVRCSLGMSLSTSNGSFCMCVAAANCTDRSALRKCSMAVVSLSSMSCTGTRTKLSSLPRKPPPYRPSHGSGLQTMAVWAALYVRCGHDLMNSSTSAVGSTKRGVVLPTRCFTTRTIDVDRHRWSSKNCPTCSRVMSVHAGTTQPSCFITSWLASLRRVKPCRISLRSSSGLLPASRISLHSFSIARPKFWQNVASLCLRLSWSSVAVSVTAAM